MKKIFQYFTTLFLASVMLAGSSGFTVGRMICLGNGQETYSLGKAKDCCEHEIPLHKAVSSKCCDLKDVSYSLDNFIFSPQVKVFMPVYDLFFASCAVSFHSSFVIHHLPFVSGLPPLESKRHLLFLQSLLL